MIKLEIDEKHKNAARIINQNSGFQKLRQGKTGPFVEYYGGITEIWGVKKNTKAFKRIIRIDWDNTGDSSLKDKLRNVVLTNRDKSEIYYYHKKSIFLENFSAMIG